MEDNKDKGAFYTPKEIVRYMCQESLIAYLETNTKVAKDKIRAFVLSPEEAVSDIPESKKSKLLTALEEVKICDPAIGSGAFPMGLLNALLRCREALSGDCYDRSELKKSIIQNNIYGVDIEKGAVDIARLRFWLSIVVDEETPSPLPNLDYKIMQGNSLIESFMGIDLSKLTYEKEHKKDKGEISLFDNEKNRLQKTVSNLLKVYYSCFDHNRKVKLQREISETINRQLEVCFVDSAILEKLKGINLAENNQFFLWHTWFSDMFSREDGRSGFDIVIGNPPYIGEKGHKEIFQPVKKDVHLGKYYLGKMDYFYFFFHLSFNMLSTNGVGIFITTNYYITALGAKKLRTDIKERMSIMTLFNLGELRLFENAPGQHNMISLFSKVNDYGKCNIVDVHKKGTLNPLMFAQITNHKDNDTIYSEISQAFQEALLNEEFTRTTKYSSQSTIEELNVLKSKFKVMLDCGSEDIDRCWAKGDTLCGGACHTGNASDGIDLENGQPLEGDSFCFIDGSGQSWCSFDDSENIFLVDTNGHSNPNRFGKDRWAFIFGDINNEGVTHFSQYKKIIPYTGKDIFEQTWYCKYPPCYYQSWLFK